MENINNEIHQINLQRRELNLQMQLLKKELGEISTPRPLQKSRIIVAVEVVQKGKVDIDVIYSIMGANWYPSYEVRVFTDVKPEEKNVELTYYGIVSQWTGEVWEDSYIFLSTAKPAVGADLPKLNPWYLNFYVPVPPPSYAVAGKARMEKAEEKAKKVFEDEVMPKEAPLTGVQFPSPPPQPVEVVTSQIERKGAGLLFKVPKSATINPDSSPNKTTIAIEKFLSTLDYVSVPKLAEYAYLRAKIKNETEYQFLPGKVNVFYGNDLVGSSSIGNIAPTEEFEVYLGIDEEIKVKRELEEKESGKSGLVGQSYKQNYAYKITVENFKKEKKKITIFDQIPISQNDDIKVKSGDIKPTPVEQTKQGILRWEFELEPKQKQEIYFQFSVEYPKDRQITGL